jgi:hypothetical protein
VASGPVAARFGSLGVSGTPARCVKGALNEGIWGEWDLPDDEQCADGRFARFPLQVFNRSNADVFATVMWIYGDTLVTQASRRISAVGSSKFSVAGIDCDPAKLRELLAGGGGGTAANVVRNSNVTDSCDGQHFQVYFWNSEAAFAGYAAESAVVSLPVAFAGGVLDLLTRAVTKGAVQLPGVAEATQFAADKWRLLRDPDSRLSTWGVHGWAYNVPQQKASVYYWGRQFAQDVVLDSANVGTPVIPDRRSPRFVYELPVGDDTPTIMQTRICTPDC